MSIDLDPERGGSIYGRGQAGNRGMDFDMSNVEEISVLRGAAATALYGSRAAAGAVVIKTKQGRPGMPVRFEYSSSARLDDPIIAGYVTDWAAGRDRFLCDGQAPVGRWLLPGRVPHRDRFRDTHNHEFELPGLGSAQGQHPARRNRRIGRHPVRGYPLAVLSAGADAGELAARHGQPGRRGVVHVRCLVPRPGRTSPRQGSWSGST